MSRVGSFRGNCHHEEEELKNDRKGKGGRYLISMTSFDLLFMQGTSIGNPFGHGQVAKIKSPLSSKKMHALWQKAILETLLLIRMNKENKSNGA